MNPDKIRNVLNILFMILALAAIITYFVAKDDFKGVYLRMRRGNFVKLMEFYTVHQQISIRALKHFKSA